MRIRVTTKFTNKETGDNPWFGSDIIKSQSQFNKVMKLHLDAVNENPEIMVTFKLVNIENLPEIKDGK